MNVRIQQGVLVNHSHQLDSIVSEIKGQATALEGISLSKDAYGLMFSWVPGLLEDYVLTDGDTVREHAETVSRCAEAVRSTSKDFGETDEGVAQGIGGR